MKYEMDIRMSVIIILKSDGHIYNDSNKHITPSVCN